MTAPAVTVELFGVARHKAGRDQLIAHGITVRELLRSVADGCPPLNDLIGADGLLSKHYLVSIDGERFVSELDDAVPPGSRLLILGADAGG